MDLNEMRKIVVIHPLDDSYGATKILSYVISILSNYFLIEVWFKNDKKCLEEFISKQSSKIENIKYNKVDTIPVVHSKIFTAKGISSLVKDFIKFIFYLFKNKNNYDFFYINTYAAGLVSFCCKLFLVKNIVHCHENQKQKFSGKALAFLIKKSANQIFCVSNVVKDYVTNGDESICATVIKNGVPDIFEASISQKKIDLSNPKFLIVGRIMPEKGYWFLADAVKTLTNNDNLSILIDAYGDAPPNRPSLLDDFRHYLKENNIENNVRLLGFSDCADRQMFNYDVVLVPSVMSDPFPTTVLEAMRAKCVIITTSHGGAAEIVSNNNNGILINKDDSDAFAEVLKNICQQKVDTELLASRAREFYATNLTKDIFEKNILNHIQNFIKDHIDEKHI
ncbi:glycosyltransferase family 4 protein [Lelliottia nimipressuralis]|jgi:glycosyltransferase involved in cell wall biosynthesis|uniref:glycosyltransferase family 4 protein n=1 Tax=Lelliottia nimipressuralis TaxID=69220 RepID=UPI003555E454